MDPEPIKVLLIEDNYGDAKLLQEYLSESADVNFELTHIDCLDPALSYPSRSFSAR
jgi:two-component system, cell cycle sensor histidine kinase and response regulator CckA